MIGFVIKTDEKGCEVIKMKGSNAESFKNRPKQRKRTRISASPYGADGRIRTGDLILTKDALYRLSYISAAPFPLTRDLLYYTPRQKARVFGKFLS